MSCKFYRSIGLSLDATSYAVRPKIVMCISKILSTISEQHLHLIEIPGKVRLVRVCVVGKGLPSASPKNVER